MPTPKTTVQLSLEQQNWNALNEPIIDKRFAGIDHPIRIKQVPLSVFDPIIYFSDSNDAGGNYRHLRADQIASLPLTQAEREKRNLDYNPLLFNRFADIGGPSTPPVGIPALIGTTVFYILSDGNCSTATMRKRVKEEKDQRSEVWIFDIVDPATSELDKECLNLLHCGHQITEWPAYAQVAKIKRLIACGMKPEDAKNRIGMKDREFKKYEATHDIHVQYLRQFPAEHGETLHTKFSRLVDAGEEIYTNSTHLQNFFTAVHNGKVGDTNYVTGAKLAKILVDQAATSVLLNQGYEKALNHLDFEFNGTKWMPKTHNKSHKTADRYMNFLYELPRIVGKLTSNDYPYLVGIEAELKAAITTAQQAMSDSLSTVAVTAAEIKRKAAADKPKAKRTPQAPKTKAAGAAGDAQIS